MIKEQEKDICDADGNTAHYTVTQFGARRGLGLKTRLIKLIAPTAVAAIGANQPGKSLMDMDINSEAVGKAIQVLLNNLDANAIVTLIMDLLASTRRDGVEVTSKQGAIFDDVYAGNYAELYQALFFVIQVNFGNLFMGKDGKGIGSLGQVMSKLMQTEASTKEH